MAILFTLDASVLVAVCRPHEPGHGASRTLLARIREAGTPLIEPAVLPVEVAAALARTGDDPALAREYADAVISLPGLTLVPVDGRLAHHAVEMAATCGLRGADAVYATVAAQYGARLVTLDAGQLKRAPASVGACKPDAARGCLT